PFTVCRHVGIRRLAGRTTTHRSDQSARPERRPSLGAVVRQLPVGIEKWRLAENGKGESGREVLFRLGLERRRRRQDAAREIRAGQRAERYYSRRPRPAERRYQDQTLPRSAVELDSDHLDL